MSATPMSPAARPKLSGLGKLIAVAAATIGIIYGYDQGNMAGALLFIEKDMNLSDAGSGSLNSVLVAGNIVGALIAGKLSMAIGRKLTMVLVAIGYAIFALWSALSGDIVTLDIARFFLGLTIGLSLVVAPIFIAESAPAQIRGSLVVGYQVATVTGILLGYLVDFGLSGSGNWELMLGLSAIPSVLVLFLLFRLPDTARWYLMKGRTEEARKTMVRADPGVDVDAEIAAINKDMESERGGGIGEMFRKPYLRATVFVLILGFLVQITGINAITYYSPKLFEQMGYHGNASTLGFPSIVQGCALVATIISLFIIDRFGRRPILMTGIGAMLVASVLMIVVFTTGDLQSGSTLGFIGIIVFTAGFNFGFGSLVWVYASESFPARLRGLGATFMLTADLVANFIVAQFFLPVLTDLGGAATFIIFGVLAAISFVFVLAFAPETKGKPLEQVRFFWQNGGRWPSEQELASHVDK
ncbi:sugar porter family MFS transporter [Sciscionella sediminilitoris]|uniref:sugar porter family MFS transporter n=1 Tax=Sciscionella sediminilitoris TaxID=1445613 RepID=UPI0009EAF62C|nr:sugar porter family MFS transporter [Sciscionella sp. SE31]